MSGLKQLVHEIHRRSLWQVLTIYLGASWAVMEVTDQIVDRYLLPEWVYPAALILLLIGMPIVLATAFVREDEPLKRVQSPEPASGGTAPEADSELRTSPPPPLRRGFRALLTWRRAILGGVLAFTLLGLASAWVVVRGVARVTEAHGAAGEAFGERAWIIVAEFEATEGEEEIALAAQTALAVDLTQSRYVNVRGRNQIVPALRRMGLTDTTRLDETIALEIAQREGMAAVLVPAVAPLGGDYVLSARVIQPQSGEELIAVRTAARAERLLEGVETLSRELRHRLGEASAAIRQSRPLPEVTTSSLEALRKYALAEAALYDRDYRRATELAVEAARLDTSFAMAHRLASVAFANAERRPQAREYAQMAYELRSRLTDRERMHVEGNYHMQRWEIHRAAEVYDALLAQYPDDLRAVNNLAIMISSLGEQERAYEGYLKAVILDPYSALRYSNAIYTAFKVEEWGVADSLITAAKERGFEDRTARWAQAQAVGLGDYARADALCDSVLEEPASPSSLADARSFCGSLSAGRGRVRQAISRFEASGQFYRERYRLLDYPNVVVGVALAEQMRGRPEAARARLEAALEIFPADSVWQFERMVYRSTLGVGAGLLGHIDLLERFAEKYPEPSGAVTWTVDYGDAMVGAARALARGDSEAAVSELRRIDAAGYVLDGWLPHAHFMYALAFDELAELDSAVAYYERTIHPRSTSESGSWGFARSQLPFVLRRLAELEEARGNNEAAIEYYRTFLELWADPDPELRDQLTSAQRALARLAGSERSQ